MAPRATYVWCAREVMLGHQSACGVGNTSRGREPWALSIGALLRNDTRHHRIDILKAAWKPRLMATSLNTWVPPRVELQRISAAAGGVAVPILAANASASAMPAAVVARRWATSVTTVGRVRRILANHQIPYSGLVAFAKVRSTVVGQARGGSSLDLSSGGTISPLVIREGEGVAIVPTDVRYGLSADFTGPCGPYSVEIIVRDTATDETYIINAPDMVFGGTAEAGTVSIVNGVGSGVVLDVLGVSVGADALRANAIHPGLSNIEAGLYRLRSPWIDVERRIRDVTADVIAADSTTTLPAGVFALQGAIPYIPSADVTWTQGSGSFSNEIAPTRDGLGDTGGVGRIRRVTTWSAQALPLFSGADYGVMLSGRGASRSRPSAPITLRPGEQIGVGGVMPSSGNQNFNPVVLPPTYWAVGDVELTFQAVPDRGHGLGRAG